MNSLQRGSAFDYRLVEQSFGRGHRQKIADLQSAAGLAKNRDVAGISAEMSDIVAHPFENRHNIQQADVARVGILLAPPIREVQVSKNIETMIYGDDHHVPGMGEKIAVKRMR